MSEDNEFEKTLSFTEEEKKWILDGLNKERLKRQADEEKKRRLEEKKKSRTEVAHSNLIDNDLKREIMDKLDKERKEAQKYKEMARKRFFHKSIYKLGGMTCYRFEGIDRIYYIEVEEAKKITAKPQKFDIYYQGFEGIRKKEVQIYIKDYSDKLYVSDDANKTQFKDYTLEER